MTRDEAVIAAQRQADIHSMPFYAVKPGMSDNWIVSETLGVYEDYWVMKPDASAAAPESFANYPKSISEIRGDKSDNGKDWKPRDALIAALRDLDSGETQIDYVAIITGSIGDGGGSLTKLYQATPNEFVLRGLIEFMKQHID